MKAGRVMETTNITLLSICILVHTNCPFHGKYRKECISFCMACYLPGKQRLNKTKVVEGCAGRYSDELNKGIFHFLKAMKKCASTFGFHH